MKKFTCKAMTEHNQVVNFVIEADDKVACIDKIKKNNMTPISVEESSDKSLEKNQTAVTAEIYSKKNLEEKTKFNEKVSKEELIKFSQDLLLLKKEKFNNKHALITIINDTKNNTLKKALTHMYHDLDKEKYMYKIMKKYPEIFPEVYMNIIKNGELNLALDKALESAINYLKSEKEIENEIKHEVMPNMIFLIISIIIIVVTIFVLVPYIENILVVNGRYEIIPIGLKTLSILVKIVRKTWILLVVIALGLVIYFKKKLEEEQTKFKIDYYKYSNKIFGKFEYASDFYRVMQSVQIITGNGLKLEEALEISQRMVNNRYMKELLEEGVSNIYKGKNWVTAFEKENLLSPIAIELLKKTKGKDFNNKLDTVLDFLRQEEKTEKEKLIYRLNKISLIITLISILLFVVFVLVPSIQIFMGGYLFM